MFWYRLKKTLTNKPILSHEPPFLSEPAKSDIYMWTCLWPSEIRRNSLLNSRTTQCIFTNQENPIFVTFRFHCQIHFFNMKSSKAAEQKKTHQHVPNPTLESENETMPLKGLHCLLKTRHASVIGALETERTHAHMCKHMFEQTYYAFSNATSNSICLTFWVHTLK